MMSVFIGRIERTPSRKDGNCSRCTLTRINFGKKPYKAKWRVQAMLCGGRVNLDDSPAEPWTKEDYDRLWKEHGSMDAILEATGTKRVPWAEMCGRCRRQRMDINDMGYYEEEAIR